MQEQCQGPARRLENYSDTRAEKECRQRMKVPRSLRAKWRHCLLGSPRRLGEIPPDANPAKGKGITVCREVRAPDPTGCLFTHIRAPTRPKRRIRGQIAARRVASLLLPIYPTRVDTKIRGSALASGPAISGADGGVGGQSNDASTGGYSRVARGRRRRG